MNELEKISEVGAKLRVSIRAAIAKGFTILPNNMRGPHNAAPTCCALGSTVTDVENFHYSVACERLGINIDQAIGIARGFDTKEYKPSVSLAGWHALGETLRRELKEGTL